MTVRDVGLDFSYAQPTASTREVISGSIAGPPGIYIAQNSIDSGPFGASFSALTANDTPLTQPGTSFSVSSGIVGQPTLITVGGVTYYTESGVGQGLKLCIDWITAPQGFGSIQSELITSATSSLSSPTIMIDFGAQPIANFFAGFRQILALPKSPAWQRFIGLQILTTGTLSAGSYISWLGNDVDSELLGYAEGFSIK